MVHVRMARCTTQWIKFNSIVACQGCINLLKARYPNINIESNVWQGFNISVSVWKNRLYDQR